MVYSISPHISEQYFLCPLHSISLLSTNVTSRSSGLKFQSTAIFGPSPSCCCRKIIMQTVLFMSHLHTKLLLALRFYNKPMFRASGAERVHSRTAIHDACRIQHTLQERVTTTLFILRNTLFYLFSSCRSRMSVNYKISIETGNRWGAGTDAAVSIIIIGKQLKSNPFCIVLSYVVNRVITFREANIVIIQLSDLSFIYLRRNGPVKETTSI